MKGLVLCLVIAAGPACAETIRAEDAWDHFGEYVTVEGRAHIQRMGSGEIYLDLDGSGDYAPLSAYVSRWNAARFSDLDALNGRTVEITGEIGSFRYRPEIFLTDPGQIAAVARPHKKPAGDEPAGFSIAVIGN